jgi:CHAT domain-containing protein
MHAIAWVEGQTRQCLLDEFEVTVAPSATVRAASLRRSDAAGSSPHRLLAVGNPLPNPVPLPGAEYEVALVAAALAAPDTVLMTRREATKSRFVDEVGTASHIHLACHGQSSFFGEPFSAELSFADEPLTAREIVDMVLVARLVVASACETGIVQGYATIDEGFGIATAFIVAGAAGVVSTLWTIDDLATALMMSRFYELLADGAAPARALREAQLWLRSVRADEVVRYTRSRPILQAQRATKAGRFEEGSDESRPYGAYEFWAPFVLTGA